MRQFTDNFDEALALRRQAYAQVSRRGKRNQPFPTKATPSIPLGADGLPVTILANGEPVETLTNFSPEQLKGSNYGKIILPSVSPTTPTGHAADPTSTEAIDNLFATPSSPYNKVSVAPRVRASNLFDTNVAGQSVRPATVPGGYRNIGAVVETKPAPVAIDTDGKIIPSYYKGKGHVNPNIKLNNPGALKYDANNAWVGRSGREGAFEKFATPQHGVRAMARTLNTKFNRGLNTINKYLKSYTPEKDSPNAKSNNQSNYIKHIVKHSGIGADTKLTNKDLAKLIKAQIVFEGDNKNYYTDDIIAEGIKMAGY